MTQSSIPEVVCAVCSTPGSGRFCSNCGAPLQSASCAGCGAELSPGARFCHNCGRTIANSPASGVASPVKRGGVASSLPWIVAAIALVTLLAFFAGNAFNSKRGSTLDAPQNALPQAGLDDRIPMGAVAPEGGTVRGPDISQLSPQERADRLFNRVMLLGSQGKTDSVLFFAPMAINAYQMLGPLNADQRYDLGRIAEVAGALPLARAQADTILRENPRHLLGLLLGAKVATLTNDASARKSFESRLLSAYEAETAKRLPEYERHADDLTNGIAAARRSSGSAR